MRVIQVVLLFCCFLQLAHAQQADQRDNRQIDKKTNGVERSSLTRLAIQEKNGVQAYQRGHYEKAFNKVQLTARMGFKQSQYVMAFLFLKGQHLKQNLILGMAWLGVAKESKIESWESLYQQIYATATPAQQLLIDQKTAQYIQQFGVKAQNISCVKRALVGKRKPSVECTARPNTTSPLYQLEIE